MPPPPASAAEGARALCRTAQAAGWTGPDIYDALGAAWPTFLTAGKRRRQALIQLHARAPVDLRPLSRRSHRRIAKTLAVFALAELRLARLDGGEESLESASRALDLLAADEGAGPHAWGYPWDMQTRWSHYRAGTPNVIVTAFAIRALREGAERTSAARLRERAAGAARWVMDTLYRPDLGSFAYHPESATVIHNATMLGARAVWSELGGEPSARTAVERAVERTLAAQRSDGSFPYGEGRGLQFVDAFHSAFVLECMMDLRTVDPGVASALERGAEFYCERFFDQDGRALLWPGRRYPEDAHSAGSGLTALARLSRPGLASRELIERVAARALESMVRRGHAVHRRHRWGRTHVAYVRWADSHMALGLADAAAALSAGASR